MKLQKLDRRMSGHGEFTHYMEYRPKEAAEFIKCRNWCWEQWGPSSELEFWYKTKTNENWCWMVDQWRVRVYLRTEAEAQWFLLKWMV
jgi:hypothetical protein